MPAYSAIADSEIDPESPITTGLMTKLRDNPLAIISADATAPTISMAAFDPGGSEVDGAVTDATVLSNPGIYDATSVVITNPVTWPFATIMRVNGDFTIDDVLTMDFYDNTDKSTAQLLALLGAAGWDGFQGAGGDAAGGGGGVGGHGGQGTAGGGLGGESLGIDTINRPWAWRRPLVGGRGGKGSTGTAGVRGLGQGGGGGLCLVVDGDLDANGGTIKANGEAAGGNRGGGGGGSIIIVCTGEISGGTYEAKGGNQEGSAADGGGGGAVILVATSFGNARTKTVTKGSGAGTGSTNGYSTEVTLTRAQILSLCRIL